jgi:hypothetical protein
MPRGIDSALQRCAGPGANAVGATIGLALPIEVGIHSTEAAIAAVQAMINAAPAAGTSHRRALLHWVRIVGSLIELRMSGTTYLLRRRTEARAPTRLHLVRPLIALAGNLVDVIAGERAPFLFWFPLALRLVAFDGVPVHLAPPVGSRVFLWIWHEY